jgi:uncharacterized RDD family membrane protein YckC
MNRQSTTQFVPLPTITVPELLAGRRCRSCGGARHATARFCMECGASFARAAATAVNARGAKPNLARRALAELIDRLTPLPFIAYFFPAWTLVVLAYHLLCDASPHRRSFGKLICRLRVVRAESLEPCDWWSSIARRLGSALSQVAWCMPELMLWALAYDLVSLAWMTLSPTGRRVEDLFAGTMVVTESAFRRNRRQCRRCGELTPLGARHCTQCGTRCHLVPPSPN